MFSSFVDFLKANELASGGLVVVVSSSLAYIFREVPRNILLMLNRILFYQVEVRNNDELFIWLAKSFSDNIKSNRMTALSSTFSLGTYEGQGMEDGQEKVLYTPSPGWHFKFLKGIPLFVHRIREKQDAVSYSLKTQETWEVKSFVWHKKKINSMIENLNEEDKKINGVNLYSNEYSFWRRVRTVKRKSLDSVILKMDQKKNLVRDISGFFKDREWYEKKNLQWKRGYLFYGPPGNGKSSLSLALASHFNLDIYRLNLQDENLTDSGILSLLRGVRSGSIVLFEDIDCIFQNREENKKGEEEEGRSKLSFSGFLNAVSGIDSPEGVIFIMTTNYKDRLDPALIRTGRADFHMEIDNPDRKQVADLYHFFYPCSNGQAEEFVNQHFDSFNSMSDVQEKLIQMDSRKIS